MYAKNKTQNAARKGDVQNSHKQVGRLLFPSRTFFVVFFPFNKSSLKNVFLVIKWFLEVYLAIVFFRVWQVLCERRLRKPEFRSRTVIPARRGSVFPDLKRGFLLGFQPVRSWFFFFENGPGLVAVFQS